MAAAPKLEAAADGTRERAWHQADSSEIYNREGQPGTAPLKMLFAGYRASIKTKASEALAQLKTLEEADKVSSSCLIFCDFIVILVALRGMGRLLGAGPGFA